MVATYPFLTLSLLFLVPGTVILALRSDLRRPLGVVAVASLPFAATEFLFYPTYWEPRTLFDLVPRIGFGIEDVLFVVGLGLLTGGSYPVVSNTTVAPCRPASARAVTRRASLLFGPAALAVVVLAIGGVPMIYGAPAIMVVAAVAVWVVRRDLVVPSIVGAGATTIVYAVLSLLFAWLIPDVFALAWHTDRFLDRYLLGIPIEELIYGGTAGLIGSIVYPFLAGACFVKKRASGPT